jgi:amino acid adenylation domain-containing protein
MCGVNTMLQTRSEASARERVRLPVDDACVHEQFDRQAALTPDAIAVIDRGRSFPYAELGRMADTLACALRRRGVGPEVPVALLSERSFDAVVGILGILKAGGAYVPIDPREPDERVREILDDADAPLILVQPDLLDRLDPNANCAFMLDHTLLADGHAEGPLPDAPVNPDDLCAIVYTSGSTGRPKGIEIPHKAIMARVRNGYAHRRHDLQKARLSVVAHFSDLLLPLISGGPVIVTADACFASGRSLLDVILRYGTTRMVFVPSQLAALFEGGDDAIAALRRLDTVLVSGEALTPALVETFKRLLPRVSLLNAYGASEVAGLACIAEISSSDEVTVGRAMRGFSVYVLDDERRPVFDGEIGEVYIGGAQVARGYRGAPALTAERFVNDSLSGSGDRLYRTGDLAQHTADGRIRILGRRDLEVKVHGWRVNLDAIEAVLQRCPGVGRAIVVAEGADADRRLIAYVQADASEAAIPGRLRSFLGEQLAPYMVPAQIRYVSDLPMLPNGKIDRLIVSTASAIVSDDRQADSYVKPRTQTECAIADIWQNLLGVSQVSVTDDFFALGGDSLDATRFILRAEDAGLIVTTEQLEDARSLAALAHTIDDQARIHSSSVTMEQSAR